VLERFSMNRAVCSSFACAFRQRVNRAWGLALENAFAVRFNFELQAAATDDAIVISLGTQHSFPLDEVFRYLNSKTVRDLLVQALLDAPMFSRFGGAGTQPVRSPCRVSVVARKSPRRCNGGIGKSFGRSFSRISLACLEHIVGDREIPDHPLVKQTIDDCLTEAMDIDGLEGSVAQNRARRDPLRRARFAGAVTACSRDPECASVRISDNAPLEERRTQAVYTRRASERNGSDGLGILDAAAIERG